MNPVSPKGAGPLNPVPPAPSHSASTSPLSLVKGKVNQVAVNAFGQPAPPVPPRLDLKPLPKPPTRQAEQKIGYDTAVQNGMGVRLNSFAGSPRAKPLSELMGSSKEAAGLRKAAHSIKKLVADLPSFSEISKGIADKVKAGVVETKVRVRSDAAKAREDFGKLKDSFKNAVQELKGKALQPSPAKVQAEQNKQILRFAEEHKILVGSKALGEHLLEFAAEGQCYIYPSKGEYHVLMKLDDGVLDENLTTLDRDRFESSFNFMERGLEIAQENNKKWLEE